MSAYRQKVYISIGILDLFIHSKALMSRGLSMATSPIALGASFRIFRGEARAVASVNIALIKYWGKADLNTPQ